MVPAKYSFRSVRGRFGLGLCYENGVCVTQNYTEAQRLYALALAQGYTKATEDLNRLDEKISSECPLLGKPVVVIGTSREDLNGRAGVALSFDHARGRYVVELGSGKGGKTKEQLKIKPEDLRAQIRRKGKK